MAPSSSKPLPSPPKQHPERVWLVLIPLAPGNHQDAFHLWVHGGWRVHKSGPCSCCPCVSGFFHLVLRIRFLGFTHRVAGVSPPFLFTAGYHALPSTSHSLVWPLAHWWTSDRCDQCEKEHLCTRICLVVPVVLSLGCLCRSGISGSYNHSAFNLLMNQVFRMRCR